ncbi:MAG: hypothetical protein IT381_11170 [Deltaproteobacteria bacterium]|nr:hypothetical protein [Deltaproteobacteria bacterium]
MPLLLALLLVGDSVGEAMIKEATAVRLDKFLEQYIGECTKGDEEDKKACKENAEKYRKDAAGKQFVVELASSIARSMRPIETKDPAILSYHFTPFFDGNGYGLTFGKPTSQDKAGNPKVKPATMNLPSGDDAQTILDGLKVDRVTIQLVFTPGEVWKMKIKGGEAIYGVGVKPVLLHLQETRSGATADTVF